MSQTVDNRVVEMQFDNRQFERNVATTMSTVDKLKQSLRFEGAAKGFDNISKSASRINMSGLGNAVETVSMKFSALQVMGVTALSNITNSAVNAGKRIVSAFTIEPIKTGFQEYETQINAVQTILANTQSKGTTLDDVNSALDQLNAYADKTIYNFTEMTRNIGTFTAAGVELDTATNAIQGIANLAAVSGSSSQQASTAMYQLSQAMASGTVKLMDWNSVVNAGMGGQVFQDALKETARVHGIAIDDMIKNQGSFRETLSEGWLTTDILTETLQKFTLTTEGLTEAEIEKNREMLRSKGYTEAQIDEIFKLGQTATDAATKVKTFSQLWDTLKEAAQSGWTQTWEILVGDFEEAKELLTEISNVIGNVIGESANARNEVLQGWKDAGGRADLIDSFKNIFEGLSTIIKPIGEAFRDIFPPLTVKQLLSFTEGLKDLTAKFKLSDETADKLKRTFKGLFALVDIGIQAVKPLFSSFAKLVGYILPAGDGLLGFTATLGDSIVKFSEFLESNNVFGKMMETVGSKIAAAGSAIKESLGKAAGAFSGIGSAAKTAFERFQPLTFLFDVAKRVFSVFAKAVKDVAPIFSALASRMGDAFSAIQDALASAFTTGNFDAFFDLVNGGLFAGILVGINKFFKSVTDITDGAGGFFEGLTDILDGVKGSLEAYQNSLKADTLLKIAGAIGILAASLVAIACLDSEKLTSALAAVGGLFVELFGSIGIFETAMGGKGFDNIAKITGSMILLSVSVAILASAMVKLAQLDWNGIAKGLVGIGGLMGELIASAKILSSSEGQLIKGAGGLIVFSLAMKIMASVCEDLSTLDWEALAKGLIGVGVLMAEMVAFTKLAGGNVTMSTAVGLLIVSAAVKVLASVFDDFGAMDWETIAKGMVGIAGSLVILAGAMHIMPKNMIASSVGLIAIGAALVIIAKAMDSFGGMAWEEIGRGLTALAGSLVLIVAATNLMKGALPGAAAMLVVSAALAIFAPVLQTLGSMSLGEIGKGILALAAAFTVIGVAGHLLTPLVPTLLSLAGAMALFGVAVAAIGAGVLMFSVGLTTLAGSVGSIVLALSSVISFIPFFFQKIGEGIVELFGVISDGMPAIAEAIKAIVISVVDAAVSCTPILVDGILVLISSVLESLSKHIGPIVENIFQILIEIINAVANKVPDLLASVVNLVMSIFSGVLDALKDIDPQVLMQGILAVGMLTAIVIGLAAVAVLAPVAMVGVLALGAVITELAVVLAAIGGLSKIPGLSALISDGGNFLQTVGTAIGQFIGGIAGGIAKGATSALPQIGSDLSSFMSNASTFIEGASSINPSALDGVKSLVGVILALTAANVLESITSWLTGGSSLSKFGDEIAAFGPKIKAYADSVAGIDGSAVEASANAAKALSEMASNLPNSGGVAGFFAGENDIDTFGTQIVAFGACMKAYANAVSGIDPEVITSSATAAKALAEMADNVPNEGGVASWFAGENSIAQFGAELVSLGMGLKGFSVSIAGINTEEMLAAASAGKALAEMAAIIPNEGGVASWFAGDNSIAMFGEELVALGTGLKGFSDSIAGANTDDMLAAAGAAKALAEMAAIIPNEGGVASWFAGDNSIAMFGEEMISLGSGLKSFATSVAGIDGDAATSAISIAKGIAALTNEIPNEGGVASWFAGENSIATFGDNLISLGAGLKSFATSVTGIDTEAATAATSVAAGIAEMSNKIPNEGGMASWLTGENSIAKFGTDLIALGIGLKSFATSVTGIDSESATAAASVAAGIADMSAHIPNSGGIASWLTGETSIAKFGAELVALGIGLKSFATSVTGIDTESMSSATAAAAAIAEMTGKIPNESGLVAWITGETSISQFGDSLTSLGEGIKGFSDSVAGIVPENIAAATEAGKAIVDMTGNIPNENGLLAWLTGETSISQFGDSLVSLGEGLAGFSDAVAGIDAERVSAASTAANRIASMSGSLPENTDKLTKFSGKLETFGEDLKAYFVQASGISAEAINASGKALTAISRVSSTTSKMDASKISSATSAVSKLIDMLKDMSKVKAGSADGFASALEKLGNTNVNGFIESIAKASETVYNAGSNLIAKLIEGMNSKAKDVTKVTLQISTDIKDNMTNSHADFVRVGENIVKKITEGTKNATSSIKTSLSTMTKTLVSTLNSSVSSFREAGANVARGFANGISSNTYLATAKARAMANAAASAAKKALNEHSPSKVFYSIGSYAGEGFVNALSDFADVAYSTSSDMALSARNGLRASISKLTDVVNNEIDSNPTIRPILDLSNIESGANAIGSMFSGQTLSMKTATVDSISASMSGYQNGSNDDVISAIRELGKDIAGHSGSTTIIDGVTYDDGSNITNAVKTLVRAAKVERRT